MIESQRDDVIVERRVSIIIIFLNEGRFIEEAIASVFAQTYTEWELLLVDDGSTDQSSDIAKGYAVRYPERVRYLEHEGHLNKGPGASRSLGIMSSRGKFVAFLDADDVWSPQKLREQVKHLEVHHNVAMVYGAKEIWYSWTGDPEDRHRDYLWKSFGLEADRLIKPPGLLTAFLKYGFVPCPSAVMIKREIIDRVGGFEERFPRMYDEDALYTKIALEFPIFVSSSCFVLHRQHRESLSQLTAKTGAELADRFSFLVWLSDYLSRNNRKSAKVWMAVQEQLWMYRHHLPNSRCLYLVEQMERVRHAIRRAALRFVRKALGKGTGTIMASPNPIEVNETGERLTQITWNSAGVAETEVRLGAANGQLFSRSGPSGQTVTGNWVNNGMVFYLQDVSGERPLTMANTIDIVRINVTVGKGRRLD